MGIFAGVAEAVGAGSEARSTATPAGPVSSRPIFPSVTAQARTVSHAASPPIARTSGAIVWAAPQKVWIIASTVPAAMLCWPVGTAGRVAAEAAEAENVIEPAAAVDDGIEC